tara:strand:+ start:41967 stop:42368 length:402 start_codon:yes stop_codon:yes gene_type:complete
MKRITSAEAKELNKSFVKTRGKAIDSAIKKKDALSSWFSIDELKEFIATVEQEGKAKGITVNGLRIYFGAYPKDAKKPKKDNLSTVFLVPTQPYKSAMQKDAVEVIEGGNDIEDLGGLNKGTLGFPPSATYPQ